MGLKRLILIVVIVCLFSVCGVCAVNWAKYAYFTNWGGLNDQLSSTEIADNEASAIQNIVFDTGGAVKKRFGYDTIPNDPVAKVYSGTSVATTGLVYYQLNNATKHVVATLNVDGACKVVQRAVTSGVNYTSGWSDITNTSVLPGSSYTNNYFSDFAVAENKLVICVGAPVQKKPIIWTGAGVLANLTADADCPSATLVEYHKNHLFLAGDDSYPSRVTFSALDNITDYTATDFFDVQTADGSRVRGLVSAYDSLYIFKDRSIWRLSGTDRDTFVLQKMVDGIGTLSQQSIAIVNNVIYFTTSQNDIAIYDGAYSVKFISQKIRQTIGDLSFTRASNTVGLAFSTYKYQDNDYYCAVSNAGSAENNRVLIFDTAYNAWTKFVGIEANAWCVAPDSNGKNILIFGDYSGYIHSYPSDEYHDGNVASSPINAFYQTKWFKYSDLALGEKYWKRLKTYALSESTSDTLIHIDCKSDYDTSGKKFDLLISQSGDKWDEVYWDDFNWSGQSLVIGTQEVEKGYFMFQGNFSNNVTDQGFTLFGWEMYVEPTDNS